MRFFNPLAGSEYEEAWGPWGGTHRPGQNWQSGSAWDLLHSSEPLPVYAPISGVVVSAGEGGKGRFAGMKVGIEGEEASAFLTHLGSIQTDRGERVEAGQQIGVSGKANGVYHLHVALGGPRYSDLSDDNGRNPQPYLRATADALGQSGRGFPLFRGRSVPAANGPADWPPPDGNTLRFVLNGRAYAGWDACRAPMLAIREGGLKANDQATVAWRKRIWRGSKDVENVVRNLASRFL